MADKSVQERTGIGGRWRIGISDADICTEPLGVVVRNTTVFVACVKCGAEFREVSNPVSGETVVVRRYGKGLIEVKGASSLLSFGEGHPRG